MERGLFGYAELAGPGHELTSTPYVVIDLETTGLSPDEDRIVEIAMARVEDGRVVDEWMTLIDPGRDPGPTFLHHISQDMVTGAPMFRDIAGEILARLEGGIVVAHHAPFEEGFLRAAFERIGVRMEPIPALDTLRVARSVLASPNYKLATCCEIAGIELTDAHTALGDVRATALLLPKLLQLAPDLRYPVAPAPLPRLQRIVGPRTRVTNLRRGETGWIRSLLTKLPISMDDHDPVGAQPYLDYLAEALSDGRLTGDKTRRLGRLAGRAGMGAAQVTELHRRFLDGLRDAALRGGALSADEQQQLTVIAASLDAPGYFADLTPDAVTAPTGPRVWVSPQVPQQSRRRLIEAGYQVATNVTRTLAAVVVAPGDEVLPKARRAAELGTQVVELAQLEGFLGTATTQTIEHDRLPAPVAPAGWYPDPTGRNTYRYWTGTEWSPHVSPGGVIFTDPLR
ncbi:DNA polymerase-3 subunit epsilon [Allocatelliglobosispora scoriae]|uniref:DNA polymerase-3 subunit epsilon n=1 Tax=Allocatelliglobosispora scoriae TaxID=643052 RepID=A0A841BZ79_9ACTN|nr:exonuclease domain-containing protein [Allocatelliglobosispora scoriae]MBB5872798.1 DNA polymerase-3 subunit epsilon [Allocatelliglobosispora scoriae]